MNYPYSTVKILNEGNSIIVVDDHCYVIRNLVDGEWRHSAWIFREALDALKELPDNPDNAVYIGDLDEVRTDRRDDPVDGQ